MKPLRPFFKFFGGKWRAAAYYPPPRYRTIIEPFAGSAGYSLRHYDRDVILVERDPIIAATWRYLLQVTPEEIRALPDIAPGQHVDELPVCQEARWLIGWWLNAATTSPCNVLSAWGCSGLRPNSFWGPTCRERIASQVEAIRHWELIEGDYTETPDFEATWFIDPPYQEAGRHYRFGARLLDYDALAAWCRDRRGQVMVCENVGAEWLPFRAWRHVKATTTAEGAKYSHEALWESRDGYLPLDGLEGIA